MLIAAALVAGCGSSSKSSSSAGTAAASSTPTSTAAAASKGGAYGAASGGTAAATPAAIVVSTKHTKMGTILAGKKHLTLYVFDADKPGSSTSACTGACASAWPPVVGTAAVAGKAVKSDLGTITRSDGTKQVTYKGHPLYYFAKDGDSGDAYGQGVKAFGANWYVVAPSGNKIDNS